MGLLDLPSPLFALVDSGLERILPASVRVALWAAVAAVISMAIYRHTSNQEALATLKPELKAIKKDLSTYDGPIDGLWSRMGIMFRLTGQQLWLTFLPALWSTLPVLFLLAYLSNAYTLHAPKPDTIVAVKPEPMRVMNWEKLQWKPESAVREDGAERYWLVVWPQENEPVTLTLGRNEFLRLPLEAPVDVVHKKKWWNWLLGNPAGYLPENAPMDEVRFSLTDRDLLTWGPGWMRFWLSPFLFFIVLFSLALKYIWRLH